MSAPRVPGPAPGGGPGRGAQPLSVLAVVGTDVHAFDRLMGWLERWWAGRTDRPRVLVQHGRSRRPDLPEAVEFLDHDTLTAAMAEATLVVSHGGPATITEARRTGHLPIVVPRDPHLHEHVDDHQQLFARRLGEAGMVKLCATEASFHSSLDAGLADPAGYRLAANPAERTAREAAVANVGRIVEQLLAQQGRRSRVGTSRRAR